jgi:hypothetical protein
MKRTLEIITRPDGTYELIEKVQYGETHAPTLDRIGECNEIFIDGKNIKESGA